MSIENGWFACRALAVVATIAGISNLGAVETQEASAPPKGAKAAHDWKKAAAAYGIAPDAPSATPLTLREEPALRWTNPLRATDDGAVFLWLDRGRPEVVGSFYRYRGDGRALEDHEFMSLATAPLVARRDGTTVWAPEVAGVTPKPIPDAPKPAGSVAERLRQMRALAGEFRASFNLDSDHSELRLLSRPLYRYEVKDRADLLDGALFAFVQTTDPEVLLLIEARPSADGGAPAWHYAVARMSMVDLKVRHKGRDAWNVGWVQNLRNPRQTYVTLTEAVEVEGEGQP